MKKIVIAMVLLFVGIGLALWGHARYGPTYNEGSLTLKDEGDLPMQALFTFGGLVIVLFGVAWLVYLVMNSDLRPCGERVP